MTGTFGESLRSTAQHAVIVVLGNIGTRPVELDPGLVIVRRARIAGSGNATFADVHRALHLMASKAVKPCIDRVLRFPDAGKGHALVEGKSVAGRVVLERLVNMHIGWKLRQLARWHPDRVAIVNDAGPWTHRAFRSRLNRFGNAMGASA